MKSIFVLIFGLAISGTGAVFAQSADDYAALTEFLSPEKLSGLQQGGSEAYAKMAYLNRHGYYLASAGSKDVSAYPDVSEVNSVYLEQPAVSLTQIQSGELNLLAYNFKLYPDKYSYYRIDGSDQILVIYPLNLTEKRRLEQ